MTNVPLVVVYDESNKVVWFGNYNNYIDVREHISPVTKPRIDFVDIVSILKENTDE